MEDDRRRRRRRAIRSRGLGRDAADNLLALRVVLDTSILKLATFSADNNTSALIYELARAGLIEAWVSRAIVEEYADVLGDHPEFVAESSRASPCAIR
jgi:PIN domain